LQARRRVRLTMRDHQHLSRIPGEESIALAMTTLSRTPAERPSG